MQTHGPTDELQHWACPKMLVERPAGEQHVKLSGKVPDQIDKHMSAVARASPESQLPP